MAVLLGSDVVVNIGNDTLAANYVYGDIYSGLITGTAVTATVSISNLGKTVKVCVFDAAENLLSEGTIASSVVGDNVVTLDTPVSIVTGTNYRLGVFCSTDTIFDGNTSGRTYQFDAATYPTVPAVFASEGEVTVADFRLFLESGVDTTPPTLTNPAATNISGTTVTPACDTDEANGTMYMVVVPDSDIPSVQQIKDGQQSSGAAAIAADSDIISATGTHTFAEVTGLTSLTNYEIYFVHTDAASNDSLASTVGFTTTAVNTTQISTVDLQFTVGGTQGLVGLGNGSAANRFRLLGII